MANIKSAKKRARQAIVRRERNIMLKSSVYTFIKRARYAIDACVKAGKKDAKLTEAAAAAVKEAKCRIDRMVPKGIFKASKANRLKSNLNASLKKVA